MVYYINDILDDKITTAMEFLLNDYFNNGQPNRFIDSLIENKASGISFLTEEKTAVSTSAIEQLIEGSVNCQAYNKWLAPKNRKFSTVIFRLYFEHFLARNWSTYSTVSYTVHSTQLNETLKRNNEALPYKTRRVAAKVVRYNLIEKLDTINGLTNYIMQVKKLNTYNTFVLESISDLVSHYELFNELFHAFMDEMTEKGLVNHNSKRILVMAS